MHTNPRFTIAGIRPFLLKMLINFQYYNVFCILRQSPLPLFLPLAFNYFLC